MVKRVGPTTPHVSFNNWCKALEGNKIKGIQSPKSQSVDTIIQISNQCLPTRIIDTTDTSRLSKAIVTCLNNKKRDLPGFFTMGFLYVLSRFSSWAKNRIDVINSQKAEIDTLLVDSSKKRTPAELVNQQLEAENINVAYTEIEKILHEDSLKMKNTAQGLLGHMKLLEKCATADTAIKVLNFSETKDLSPEVIKNKLTEYAQFFTKSIETNLKSKKGHLYELKQTITYDPVIKKVSNSNVTRVKFVSVSQVVKSKLFDRPTYSENTLSRVGQNTVGLFREYLIVEIEKGNVIKMERKAEFGKNVQGHFEPNLPDLNDILKGLEEGHIDSDLHA